MGFGGRTRFHKNIIALHVGGGGGPGITPEGRGFQKGVSEKRAKLFSAAFGSDSKRSLPRKKAFTPLEGPTLHRKRRKRVKDAIPRPAPLPGQPIHH